MSDEINQLRYALSRHVPDMQWRGFMIGTGYGELEVSAEDGREIIQAVQAMLQRKLDAACAPAKQEPRS